jgi:hypothetical protein
MRSCRPARAERVTRSHAHTHAPVPCLTRPCTATNTRRHATPALPPGRTDRPRQARIQTCLN